MGTLTVTEFISLDGVIDSPGGEPGYAHAGWTFDLESDPAMYGAVAEAYEGVTGLVLGRLTYEGFAAAWPQREDSGDEDAGFAVQLGDLPKYVVSRTLTDPSWRNTTVLSGVDDVAALRRYLVDEGFLERGGQLLLGEEVLFDRADAGFLFFDHLGHSRAGAGAVFGGVAGGRRRGAALNW